MIVTFVLFGHWMEMKSRRGTNDALRELFDLVQPTATVIRGGQEIELPTADGQGLVAAHLGPGEFFGEMSLMTGEDRTADVVAHEETSVLVIDRGAMTQLMEKHPDIVEHMSRVLAERQASLVALKEAGEAAPRDSVHDERELMARIRRFFGS